MKKTIAMVPALMLLGLLAMAGCARHTSNGVSASPATDNKVACENAGGHWKSLTQHCDMD